MIVEKLAKLIAEGLTRSDPEGLPKGCEDLRSVTLDGRFDLIAVASGITNERSADGVDVTPEMIEAGINAIDVLDRGLLMPSEEVALIYKAMHSASG